MLPPGGVAHDAAARQYEEVAARGTAARYLLNVSAR